jgi:hypothetical protein
MTLIVLVFLIVFSSCSLISGQALFPSLVVRRSDQAPPPPPGCLLLFPPHPRAGSFLCCPDDFDPVDDGALCQSNINDEVFCANWGNPGVRMCKGAEGKTQRANTSNRGRSRRYHYRKNRQSAESLLVSSTGLQQSSDAISSSTS